MKKIIIIGGGPAGMMTAASILQNAQTDNFEIILLEKNTNLGKKLLISGGGRCNVTTGIFDKKILRTKYTRGFDFLEHSLQKFGPKKCKKWFENEGIPLKIEEDLRIFPCSDNGQDVLDVFGKIFQNHSSKIQVFYKASVKSIQYEHDSFLVQSENATWQADFVVIATGGNAYSHTGSQGDGYHFARQLGHSVTQLGPSLSSFVIAEDFLKTLSGVTFQNAKLIFDKQNYINGSLLFTHFGISGPLAFMLSSQLAWKQIQNTEVYFCPIADMNFNDWNQFLISAFEKFPKRKISNILKEKLPHKFCDIIIEQFGKNIQHSFVCEISKKQREDIAKTLGNGIKITLLDRRPGDEFVTAGGVNTDEIIPETLESKYIPQLFFVGEVLNVDGYTGGFSLQICWSTGYQAGHTIAQKIQ